MKRKRNVLNISAILLWLAVWQLMSVLVDKELLVPSPISTVKALGAIVQEASFYNALGYSLMRILLGFMLAALFALILGVLSGLSSSFEILIRPLITVIRSTPVMSFVILAIIWFSYNFAPLAVNLVMCFPPIYDNVVKGIKETDVKLLDMAKIYKVPKHRVFTGIYWGSMLPYYHAGMNTALGLSFRVAIAGEVLANPRYGIGTNLLQAKYGLDTPKVFAWTLVILFLSYVFEFIYRSIVSTRKIQYKSKDI